MWFVYWEGLANDVYFNIICRIFPDLFQTKIEGETHSVDCWSRMIKCLSVIFILLVLLYEAPTLQFEGISGVWHQRNAETCDYIYFFFFLKLLFVSAC